jgi:hypothetical protein
MEGGGKGGRGGGRCGGDDLEEGKGGGEMDVEMRKRYI